MKKQEKSRGKGVALIAITLAIAAFGMVLLTVQSSCDFDSKGLREQYFDCPFQKKWAEELPEIPEDFYEVRGLFQYNYVEFQGKVLQEEYWKQPEWYPNVGENINTIAAANKHIKETGNMRRVAWCSGVYPSEFYVATKSNRTFTTYAWVKNIPIQYKYIGINLEPIYPSKMEVEKEGREVGLDVVTQDTVYAKNHINISFSPDEFMLDPAYPTLGENYARMITMTVSVSEDIEPGLYVTGFMTDTPSKGFSLSARLQHGFDYTAPRGEFACSPRHYQLIIEVE